MDGTRRQPIRLPRPWERDAEDRFLDADEFFDDEEYRILLPDLETMDFDDEPDDVGPNDPRRRRNGTAMRARNDA
jgi:hypothetical protein